MSDINPASIGFNDGFGPFTGLGATPRTDAIVTPETSDEPNKDKQEPVKSSLLDKLRTEREARANKAKQDQESTTIKSELDRVRKEYEQLKLAPKFEDDPIGYAKARKLTPEQQILLGESLIYDLAPDKAPADLRQRLYEQKQDRQRLADQAQALEQSQRDELNRANRAIEIFAQDLDRGVRSFQSGSYPESEDWFTDSNSGNVDYDSYCKSLMATANNLATRAKQNNTVADLSHNNIAKTLEAALAQKQAIRDKRRAVRAPNKSQERQVAETKDNESIDVTSSRGLNTKGKAETLVLSDRERIDRAIRAGFGN